MSWVNACLAFVALDVVGGVGDTFLGIYDSRGTPTASPLKKSTKVVATKVTYLQQEQSAE